MNIQNYIIINLRSFTNAGVVELVDFGHMLPGLEFESGRSHWRVS